MEDAQDVGAGVDDRHASVVGGQDPVGGVGSDWGQEEDTSEVRRYSM